MQLLSANLTRHTSKPNKMKPKVIILADNMLKPFHS